MKRWWSHIQQLLVSYQSLRPRAALRHRWWVVLLLLYLLSGIYFVAPEQQAVVLRFGRVAGPPLAPGLHYHLPFPIERIVKLKVLETKRLTVGIEMPDQFLGRDARGTPTQYLTGDQNIINLQMAVQFNIKDAAAYLFRAQDVAQLVARAVEAAFTQTVAGYNVDSLLTTGKVEVQNATWQESQQILDLYHSGVALHAINIETVAPPAEVADAFREVASARADRERIINEAHGYANDALAKARGEASKLLSEATSYRQQRINEAQGEAARFEKLIAEYSKAKDITERRLYLETMEEVLPRIKKVIIDSHGPKSLIELGLIRPSP